MRSLVFINRYAWPDDSATAQLLSDLSGDLVRRGHRVIIVASRQLYRAPDAGLDPEERWKGVEIHRIRSTRFGRDRLLGRALDYISFYLSLFAYLLFRMPWRPVLVTLTDPPLVTVVTWLPALLKNARQLHWSQDVFPEIVSAVEQPRSRLVRAGLRVLRTLRNLSLRPGVELAVLGEDMRAHFLEQGIPAERISILPNWSSSEEVFPVPREENLLRSSWNLNDAFVLGYSGNLGRVHDYGTFLDAAEILVERLPGIRFLFIGSGALHMRLQENLPDTLRAHTLFKPYQERRLLSQSLSIPDLHWISLQGSCTRLVFPSKFYGILAAGRPTLFIGDSEAELARQVEEAEVGVTVAQGDGVAMAEAVLQLAGDPERRRDMGERAYRLFHQRFDRSLALARWASLLDRMATPESSI